jgi:hypothetical protein
MSSNKEESEREQTTSDRWEPAVPPSRTAKGAAVESTLETGAEPPIAGSSAEVPVGASEAPVGIVEAPLEPSRKWKRGFSSLK